MPFCSDRASAALPAPHLGCSRPHRPRWRSATRISQGRNSTSLLFLLGITYTVFVAIQPADAVLYDVLATFDVSQASDSNHIPACPFPSPCNSSTWRPVASAPYARMFHGGGDRDACHADPTLFAPGDVSGSPNGHTLTALDNVVATLMQPMEALLKYYYVITDHPFLMDTGGTISVSLSGDGITPSSTKFQAYLDQHVLPYPLDGTRRSRTAADAIGADGVSEVPHRRSGGKSRTGDVRGHESDNGGGIDADARASASSTGAAAATTTPGSPISMNDLIFFFYNQPRLHCLFNAPVLLDCFLRHSADGHHTSGSDSSSRDSSSNCDIPTQEALTTCSAFMPSARALRSTSVSAIVTSMFMATELDLRVMLFDAETWYRLMGGSAQEQQSTDPTDPEDIAYSNKEIEFPWSSTVAATAHRQTRQTRRGARNQDVYNLNRDPAKVCTAPAMYTIPLNNLIAGYKGGNTRGGGGGGRNGGSDSDSEASDGVVTIVHGYPPARLIAVLVQCSGVPVVVEMSLELRNVKSRSGSLQHYYTSVVYFVAMACYAILFVVLLLMMVRCERHRHDTVSAKRLRKEEEAEAKRASASTAAEFSAHTGGSNRADEDDVEMEEKKSRSRTSGSGSSGSRSTAKSSRKHSLSKHMRHSTPSPSRHGHRFRRGSGENGSRGATARDRRTKHSRKRSARASSISDSNTGDDSRNSNGSSHSQINADMCNTSAASSLASSHTRTRRGNGSSAENRNVHSNSNTSHHRSKRKKSSVHKTKNVRTVVQCIMDGMKSIADTVSNAFLRFFAAMQDWWNATHIDVMLPALQWIIIVMIPLKCLMAILRAAEFSLLSGMSVVRSTYALPTVSIVITVCTSTTLLVLEVLVGLGWGLAYETLALGQIVTLTLACMSAFAVYVAASTCAETGRDFAFTRNKYARGQLDSQCRSINYTRAGVEIALHLVSTTMMFVQTGQLGSLVGAMAISSDMPLSEKALSYLYRVDPDQRRKPHHHSAIRTTKYEKMGGGNREDNSHRHRQRQKQKQRQRQREKERRHRRLQRQRARSQRRRRRRVSSGDGGDSGPDHSSSSLSASSDGRSSHDSTTSSSLMYSSEDSDDLSSYSTASSSVSRSSSWSSSDHSSTDGGTGSGGYRSPMNHRRDRYTHGNRRQAQPHAINSLRVPTPSREAMEAEAKQMRHDEIQRRLTRLFLRYRGMRTPFAFLAVWPVLFLIFSFTFYEISDYYMEAIFAEVQHIYLFGIILLFMRHGSFYC